MQQYAQGLVDWSASRSEGAYEDARGETVLLHPLENWYVVSSELKNPQVSTWPLEQVLSRGILH